MQLCSCSVTLTWTGSLHMKPWRVEGCMVKPTHFFQRLGSACLSVGSVVWPNSVRKWRKKIEDCLFQVLRWLCMFHRVNWLHITKVCHDWDQENTLSPWIPWVRKFDGDTDFPLSNMCFSNTTPSGFRSLPCLATCGVILTSYMLQVWACHSRRRPHSHP